MVAPALDAAPSAWRVMKRFCVEPSLATARVPSTPLNPATTARVPERSHPVGKITLIFPLAAITAAEVNVMATFPVEPAIRDAGTTE